MNVLVVDDNKMDLMIIKSFVEKAEMSFIEAESASEALNLITQRTVSPDIIVVDWLMPDMDGLELCRLIRNLNLDITPYIIIITASELIEVEYRALDQGADDFIEKPLDGNVFIARLRVGAKLIKMQKKLIELAQKDDLTGLCNRRAGIQSFENHLSRLARSSEQTEHCLIIADIDHFKSINDNYGHLMGDRVLIEIAKRLRETIRPFETVARFGGEEFLIYCEANRTQAEFILKRLKQAISSSLVNLENEMIPVTMSFGCTIIRQYEAKNSPDSFIAKADKLLYQVKDEGRNDFKIGAFN